jgi:predicted anti-sigma-YlaC factor YlaD
VTPQEIICHQFVELVTEYLDEALPAGQVELVEEHLVMCDWCRDYLDQIETTSAALAETAPPAPPDETLHALLGAFRAHTGGDARR